MKGSTKLRKRLGVAALATIGTLTAVALPAVPASAFTKPPQAYGGYGSGAEIFANLVPTAQLAKAQVAVARSAVNSQGLTSITDELGNSVSTANGDKASRATGAALELNVLGQPLQLVAPAQADAPVTGPTQVNSLLELPLGGLAFADLLEGRASARFNDQGSVCIVGADLANGRGQAANVQLLGGAGGNNGLVNPLISLQDPKTAERDVVNTISRQLLTGQVRKDGSIAGNKLGVLSEVTQTVAPITIADPTGNLAIAIEVAGVYQLRAFAGGLPGTSFIEYNPANNGQAPVISLTLPPTGLLGGLLNPIVGPLVTTLGPLTGGLLQFNPATGQLLIPLGPVLSLLQPLLDVLAPLGIVIGEGPRAIGGTGVPLQAADGTASGAAVDLVRIRPAGLLAPLAGLVGDIRVGHMEVLAFANAGGITCPDLGVNKTTDKDPVQAGESFVYTITATNPYDCTLTNVRVQDDITGTAGVSFAIGNIAPPASTVTAITGGQQVVFNDIGPIGPRGSKAVQIQLTVAANTAKGRISDTAKVTASCATGGGTGSTNINLNLGGSFTLNAPQVGPGTRVSGGELPRTGQNDGVLLALGLSSVLALAGVEVLRRRSRTQA